ncbi:SDR family NAD(P)-dependent oxidoreductase [Burkholderia sp. BCC1977]|uniref:SDR family NAD(P)-dependent oxidoreductase n=1 Tax=Burkholderia sp. BCC1977 TaxID=2817440 RepID=UPI002ABD9672|nr:SDR family NAD(P)-dependent oxidoreductase [Burkholderia sp. BCC1977]
MNIDLSGKTALITASTAGIGFAIAKALADSGALVIINGRSVASVAGAKERLSDALPNVEIHGVAADLGDAAGVQRLIDTVSSQNIDILINNAGIFGQKDFFETGDDTWEQYWQTNVMSGVRLSRSLTGC